VRVSDGTIQEPLIPFTPTEEPGLRTEGVAAYFPTHYELRPNGIVLLPEHAAGKTVTVEYIPVFTDLTDASNNYLDGINGWEEYVTNFAARCMAVKDEEWQLVGAIDADMKRLSERITKIAPKRDRYKPRRVSDVRGARMHGARRY
jgi:hypothetical protein